MKKQTSFLSIILIGLVLLACGKTEQNETPAKPDSQSVQPEDTTDNERLYVNLDVAAASALKQGDTLRIGMEGQDKVFNLQIRKLQESIPGITSISANIESRDTGLATLILRDGKLSGMLDLYSQNLKYRVQYDSTRQSHYLEELLPEDLDQMEGSAPLEPGKSPD